MQPPAEGQTLTVALLVAAPTEFDAVQVAVYVPGDPNECVAVDDGVESPSPKAMTYTGGGDPAALQANDTG